MGRLVNPSMLNAKLPNTIDRRRCAQCNRNLNSCAGMHISIVEISIKTNVLLVPAELTTLLTCAVNPTSG